VKITIECEYPASIDIQWLHGVLHHAINQPGSREYHVDIADPQTLKVTVAKEFSEIEVKGAAYDLFALVARKNHLTPKQMEEWLESPEVQGLMK
jgi:hypothetical protein